MIPTRHDLDPCPAGCGGAVLWTITEHGNRMAVDPEPHDAGNQAVFRDGPGTWRSRSLDGRDARPLDRWEHRYRPHVATCTRHAVQHSLPGLPSRPRRRPARRRYTRRDP